LGGLALAITLMSATACADSDAARGARTFQRCYACHSMSGDDRLSGPTLRGVFGRRAGTLRGFEYSPVLREAGQRGLIWSAETLDRFLEDPEEMVPGVRMGGLRVRDPDERRAFIRWLQRAAK
jgi:cytochrome c